MELKKCSTCKIVKTIDCFHIDKTRKSGLYPRCKICHSTAMQKQRRTISGFISNIYSRQKVNSKRRNHALPNYTCSELKEWVKKQEMFYAMYKKWEESGFCNNITPSIDRINDYKPYTIDNIQLTTIAKNKEKGYSDRKNGINNKTNKAVIGINIVTGAEVGFFSQREAERITGIDSSFISACCNGKKRNKSAGGFIWKLIN